MNLFYLNMNFFQTEKVSRIFNTTAVEIEPAVLIEPAVEVEPAV